MNNIQPLAIIILRWSGAQNHRQASDHRKTYILNQYSTSKSYCLVFSKRLQP